MLVKLNSINFIKLYGFCPPTSIITSQGRGILKVKFFAARFDRIYKERRESEKDLAILACLAVSSV